MARECHKRQGSASTFWSGIYHQLAVRATCERYFKANTNDRALIASLQGLISARFQKTGKRIIKRLQGIGNCCICFLSATHWLILEVFFPELDEASF